MKSMHSMLGSYGATALMLIALAFPGSAFAIAGKFQFVNGQVQIINTAGSPHNVSKGDVINEGDTISASANGFAQIKMEDGGFFAVRPDTQFKVDTFTFNGKEDGSEKGIFSLIKGSLRSVTGLIGKTHRDNYKIVTASSTIGIRGSGADVGHDDSIGTAVHTLFGGHTLTSNGKTIETGPGQTALAAPGQAPKFVPSFPFNTSTSPGDKQGNGPPGNDKQGNNDKGQNGNNNSGNNNPTDATGLTNPKVVIPITTTNGFNLTTNTDSSGNPIGGGSPRYLHFLGGILNTGSGFQFAEQGSHENATYPFSNYTFDSSGALTGVASSNLNFYNADEFNISTPSAIITDEASSLVVISGTVSDLYHTPDDSIFIGRGTNQVVLTTCSSCSGTDTFVSTLSIVGLATAPAFVQTITGSTTYTVVGSTHPADGFGNVGTLNTNPLSTFLRANFTAQTVDLGASLFINNKTIDASASGLPIFSDGFGTKSGSGLTVNCTGSGCGGGYVGGIDGKFFGNAAATAGFRYLFFPSSDVSAGGNFTDLIQGAVAFSASSTPSATPGFAGPVGSGGSAVGLATAVQPGLFNGFNVVDNSSFSARVDTNGNLIAFDIRNSSGGNLSASLGTDSVVVDGSDSSLGVTWGRWKNGTSYNAITRSNDTNSSLAPSGALTFITGTQITTDAQLAAMPGLGIPSATYNLASGSFPTTLDGVSGSHLTSGSANVSFSANTISISLAGIGTPGSGFNNWNASGSGAIADFKGQNGIALSGSCSGGGGVCSSVGTSLNSSASSVHGGFVGAQAQGLISTFGLTVTGGSMNLAGAAYMKR